jgi:hypothetical protein
MITQKLVVREWEHSSNGGEGDNRSNVVQNSTPDGAPATLKDSTQGAQTAIGSLTDLEKPPINKTKNKTKQTLTIFI